VIGNQTGTAYSFAVAVSNTSDLLATVTIEDGALSAPDVFTVPPHGVRVEKLPWQLALKLCPGASWKDCVGGVQADGALAAKGAFHLRSTVPVTVYQFNPLEYSLPGVSDISATNDASLLLPTTAWRRDYLAASWPGAFGNPSELAVTAWHDGTHVTLTTRADTAAGGGAPAFAAGVAQTITLGAGDVLEITSRTGDLTGSRITSDAPVGVWSGHYAATVPVDMMYADHLEEQMFPIAALAGRYVIVAPAVPGAPDGKIEVVRVIATAEGTTLTYDPPQPGAPATIAHAGDFVELDNTAATFQLTASQPVLVAQYMEGSQATPEHIGDPSLALAVPVEQFRTSYLVHAPINYATNDLDVVAPAGATVMLDGTPLSFTPIGDTGFALARVQPLGRGPNADGNHALTGSAPFGVNVYGYGTDTSYWYPGGLELHPINVQ
jgi:hypothetical protein